MWIGTISTTARPTSPLLSPFHPPITTAAVTSSDMNDSEYSANTAWSYMPTSRRQKNISQMNGSEIGTSRKLNL